MIGTNSCPPGTIAGGWWKADGSSYCAGPRYYIDCNATCRCGCGTDLSRQLLERPVGLRVRQGRLQQPQGRLHPVPVRAVQPAGRRPSAASRAAWSRATRRCSSSATARRPSRSTTRPPTTTSPACKQKAVEEDDVEHGMAVDVILNPTDPTSGYTLDRWGGVHAFGSAVAVQTASFWPGQDVARHDRRERLGPRPRLRDGPRRRAAPVQRCARGSPARRTGAAARSCRSPSSDRARPLGSGPRARRCGPQPGPARGRRAR